MRAKGEASNSLLTKRNHPTHNLSSDLIPYHKTKKRGKKRTMSKTDIAVLVLAATVGTVGWNTCTNLNAMKEALENLNKGNYVTITTLDKSINPREMMRQMGVETSKLDGYTAVALRKSGVLTPGYDEKPMLALKDALYVPNREVSGKIVLPTTVQQNQL